MSEAIITCAVTGSVHTPTMSPNLPVTPDEIAAQAVAAAEAGAAILHLHARDPADGRPSPDPAIYAKFLPAIVEATDAVVNITTGGSHTMSLDDRLAAALEFAPEMTSLNMGSMNFNFSPLVRKYDEWQHSWEPEFLRATDDMVFKNTFRDIHSIIRSLGDERGVRFEFECYDVGHLYNLAHVLDEGWYEPPLFIQTIFGILGGIGAELDHLLHMRRTADRLFGDDYEWSTLAVGPHQMRLGAVAATLGGHVRVGLEDSLTIGRGQLAADNAEQVAKIVRILDEFGITPASPARARELLGLKGAAATNLPTA